MLILNMVIALISFLGVVYLILKKQGNQPPHELNDLIEKSIRTEFLLNREEFSKSLKDNRQELTQGLERLTEKMEIKLISINGTLNSSG